MNSFPKPDQSDSWKLYLILAIAATIFSGLFDHDVWSPDEPRVAAIIHAMYTNGDYFIPKLAGMPFVEKPPLFFILSAFVMHLTGLSALMAGRLTLALLCFGSLFATFRLAAILKDRNYAWICVSVLATLEGFVLNFHWLRVDAALMFTTITAIWAFAEAYLNFKPRYLLLAGALSGLAFLTKGPVALVLCIGLACFPLFIRYCYLRRLTEKDKNTSWLVVTGYHVSAVVIMFMVIAAWLYPFYKNASPELWNEWFWVNQVDRLTGTAQLGHIHSGEPFYYVAGLIEYTLPWSLFLLAWLVLLVKKIPTEKQINWIEAFYLFWFALSIFILSYSATKRSMYLAPLTPLFALIIGHFISQTKNHWVSFYNRFWIGLFSVLLIAFAISPLWSAKLHNPKIPESFINWLGTWHLTALLIPLAIVLMLKIETIKWPSWVKLSLTAALFYCAFFNYLIPGVNVAKSMKSDLQSFASNISAIEKNQTAGIGFSETMSAIFYLYDDWSVPLVDETRAQKILDGEDNQYKYLLIDTNPSKDLVESLNLNPETQYHIIAQGHPTSDKKNSVVLWLSGKN